MHCRPSAAGLLWRCGCLSVGVPPVRGLPSYWQAGGPWREPLTGSYADLSAISLVPPRAVHCFTPFRELPTADGRDGEGGELHHLLKYHSKTLEASPGLQWG